MKINTCVGHETGKRKLNLGPP